MSSMFFIRFYIMGLRFFVFIYNMIFPSFQCPGNTFLIFTHFIPQPSLVVILVT